MLLKLRNNFLRNSLFNTVTANFIKTMATTRKPRYDGRSKKRQWEERRLDKGEGLDIKKQKNDDDLDAPFERIKKRKFALLLGYSGVDYFGMQRNPNTRTIEEDLFTALLKAEYINQESFDQVQNVQFQRAARTDKGVSAARQVISIKLPETTDISKLNELLPPVIRIFGIKRVTKGFNSKSQCDGRTYMYMLPTVAFAEHDETTPQEEFRLGDEKLIKINEVLNLYIGTKNFHNFTSKKKSNDPSAKRYIMSFECEKPFIRKNTEFAVLKVKGQSFMLHQIRKMIGLVLAIIKGHTTTETLTKAFTQERVNIPRAPGLGLVLDYVHYERYNYRYGTDGVHETLIWDAQNELVNEFKEEYIYPTIINAEVNEKPMVSWCEKLYRHRYEPTEGENNDEQDSDSEEESNKNNETSDSEGSKEKNGDSVSQDKIVDNKDEKLCGNRSDNECNEENSSTTIKS